MLAKKTPIFCIFAKPPVADEVKTRLIPRFGKHGAKDLARAFLMDTLAMYRHCTWARCIVATTTPFRAEILELAGDLPVWDQGTGDFGDRIEKVLQRALEMAPIALAVGIDSPGMPRERLEEARHLLHTHDAAIGPADDGGFYLLGLKQCPKGLLEGVPWSQKNTYDRTLSRLEQAGANVAVLKPWFDVDHPEDVTRLSALLEKGDIHAPATLKVLEALLKK